MAKVKNNVQEEVSEKDFLNETEIDESLMPDVEAESAPTAEEIAQMKANFERKKQLESEVKITARKAEISYKNPLKNKRICIRHIAKESPLFNSSKHIYTGGMADNATKTFCCPCRQDGVFVNILSEEEQAFFESILGLAEGSMSPFIKGHNNYWATKFVSLGKEDTYLDLSNPNDYISYKILLANVDFICPSVQDLHDKPKKSYMYVVVESEEETTTMKKKLDVKLECYKLYGKYSEDRDTLRYIIETFDGRNIGNRQTIEWMGSHCDEMIQADAKRFLKIASDNLLDTKVLILKCVEAGLISKRNNLYYDKFDGQPLCQNGEESTITNAAIFLNLPKNQELKYKFETKI